MQPTNPNAHTHVDGTDVETHGYAVTQKHLSAIVYLNSLVQIPRLPVRGVEWKV